VPEALGNDGKKSYEPERDGFIKDRGGHFD
jgi:hypothetical protein